MVGEVSAAESNHNSRQKAKKKVTWRNPRCPIEGHHQVVVPLWLDMPYCKRKAKEWGCTPEQAADKIYFQENDY